MKYIVVIATLLAFYGCANQVEIGNKLDQEKIGNLSFSQNAGNNVFFNCNIPKEELAPVLSHLQHLGVKKTEITLVTDTQHGTLEYNKKDVNISWSRIKMGETVFRFTIEKNIYELKSPYGEQFSLLVAKHRKKALFPVLLKK